MWRRFAASARIAERGPSITASATTTLRRTGRQWRNQASAVRAMIGEIETVNSTYGFVIKNDAAAHDRMRIRVDANNMIYTQPA